MEYTRKYICSVIVWIFLLAGNTGWGIAAMDGVSVLATVNGDAITAKDVLDRAGVQSSRTDLFGIVDGLVDERLMVQEALRLELDHLDDFLNEMDMVVTRASVSRLQEEEILAKSMVSDVEIMAFLQTRHGDRWHRGENIPETLHRRVATQLEKKNETLLSRHFFQQLRRDADMWIDEALVREIDLEKPYDGEKEVIGRVNGQAISVSDFLRELKETVKSSETGRSRHKRKGRRGITVSLAMKDKTLDRLVTYILVEQEALRRNYLQHEDFAAAIEKKKERLLLRTFQARVLYPLAVPDERDLKRYYRTHRDEFKSGYDVAIGEMRFHRRVDAERALAELKAGANFDFLASQIFLDRSQDIGPSVEKQHEKQHDKKKVWIKITRFPQPVREVIAELHEGEFSGIIVHGEQFKIIQVKGKRGGKVVPYDKVEDEIKKVVGKKAFDRVLLQYVSKLRARADIRIDYDGLKDLEATLSGPDKEFPRAEDVAKALVEEDPHMENEQ